MFEIKEHPHKRKNILTGEWVLVSPNRSKRPWQGKVESMPNDSKPEYDPNCYLCLGNARSDGSKNPYYKGTYVFTNYFSALLSGSQQGEINKNNILVAKSESGICKVICFLPNHSLTLPVMEEIDIEKVVNLWQSEFLEISKNNSIKYIQIFEDKGDIMGCINPHPYGQIWASSSIPFELEKETNQQKQYYETHNRSLLSDYLDVEREQKERIVLENDHFLVVAQFWAVWPYETMIISKRHVTDICKFYEHEKKSLANILKKLTFKYDNLFNVSFPYSAGIHQSPVIDGLHEEWHWHTHFYPPLLRAATVKKNHGWIRNAWYASA